MISKITIETDLVSLNEVLNQTGNPEVAVQILNGTYQEPEIPKLTGLVVLTEMEKESSTPLSPIINGKTKLSTRMAADGLMRWTGMFGRSLTYGYGISQMKRR